MSGMVLTLFAAVAVIMVLTPSTLAQAPEKRRTGNVCSTDIECPDNAFCKAGSYCECKVGYVYAAIENADKVCLKGKDYEKRSVMEFSYLYIEMGSETLSKDFPAFVNYANLATYGDPCEIHIQCHTQMGVHAECVGNRCACVQGTQFVQDRCYKMAAIGERCLTDNNCYLNDAVENQAFCVRGFCTCQLQYSPRDNGTRCVKDAVLGEKCEDELQCAAYGLECRQGTCKCKEGFVAHNQTNVCIESLQEIGASCEYDVQCDALSGVKGSKNQGAARCLGGVCSCAYNAREAGDPPRCWIIRHPGAQCTRDEECVGEENEPGFCRKGFCSCSTCGPDIRDFTDKATAMTPINLMATFIIAVAILA